MEFKGQYAFLSNFAPALVELDLVQFKTVEHAYVAAKTESHRARLCIAGCRTPASAKKEGRKLRLREGWDDMRVPVMRALLMQKFVAGSAYGQMLLDTGDAEIVEDNWWKDTFWGKCGGVGENNLGILLMEIRESLNNSL